MLKAQALRRQNTQQEMQRQIDEKSISIYYLGLFGEDFRNYYEPDFRNDQRRNISYEQIVNCANLIRQRFVNPGGVLSLSGRNSAEKSKLLSALIKYTSEALQIVKNHEGFDYRIFVAAIKSIGHLEDDIKKAILQIAGVPLSYGSNVTLMSVDGLVRIPQAVFEQYTPTAVDFVELTDTNGKLVRFNQHYLAEMYSIYQANKINGKDRLYVQKYNCLPIDVEKINRAQSSILSGRKNRVAILIEKWREEFNYNNLKAFFCRMIDDKYNKPYKASAEIVEHSDNILSGQAIGKSYAEAILEQRNLRDDKTGPNEVINDKVGNDTTLEDALMHSINDAAMAAEPSALADITSDYTHKASEHEINHIGAADKLTKSVEDITYNGSSAIIEGQTRTSRYIPVSMPKLSPPDKLQSTLSGGGRANGPMAGMLGRFADVAVQAVQDRTTEKALSSRDTEQLCRGKFDCDKFDLIERRLINSKLSLAEAKDRLKQLNYTHKDKVYRIFVEMFKQNVPIYAMIPLAIHSGITVSEFRKVFKKLTGLTDKDVTLLLLKNEFALDSTISRDGKRSKIVKVMLEDGSIGITTRMNIRKALLEHRSSVTADGYATITLKDGSQARVSKKCLENVYKTCSNEKEFYNNMRKCRTLKKPHARKYNTGNDPLTLLKLSSVPSDKRGIYLN